MAVCLSKDSIGKVSVIIPFYNQAEFIDDAIQSLINQSYTNWEAIIVNDGSQEPLPEFHDNRVRVIMQENKGLPAARNTGLRNATGEYVQFLDADDMLAPFKFESQIQGMNARNADISVSGYLAFHHPDASKGTSTDTELKGISPLHDFVTRWENGLCIPIHCFLYKRYVICKAGCFAEDLPNHEDWDFHIRVAQYQFIYCHDPAKFALYRVHEKSMCRTTDMEVGKQMVIDRHHGWDSVDAYNRIPLMDVTFVYTVRVDSEDRLNNLDFAMSFMWSNFYTNIIVIEEDSESRILGRYRNIKHIFIQSDNPIMHRTKLINDAVRSVNTPYFCNIDVDVFMSPNKYVTAVYLLQQYDVVYPYNGKFYDLPKHYVHNKALDEKDIVLSEAGMINPNSYGGMVFFRLESFKEGGMENENFVSWGPEDNERYLRFKKLGYAIYRMPNPIYHFTHYRGVNSNEDNPNYQRGVDEYDKISVMSRDELKAYVKTFNWL